MPLLGREDVDGGLGNQPRRQQRRLHLDEPGLIEEAPHAAVEPRPQPQQVGGEQLAHLLRGRQRPQQVPLDQGAEMQHGGGR